MQRVGLDRALGGVGVGVGDGGADVLQADAVLGQRQRIDLDAHRGQRAAGHIDAADAIDLRQPLRDHRIGGIVDLALREHVRGHGELQDRKVASC